MQSENVNALRKTEKLAVIVIAFLLSSLSFIQLVSGFNRTLDTVGSTTYPNYIYLALFVAFGFFSLSHKNRYYNVSLLLFSIYVAFGYLIATGLSPRNVFLAITMLTWVLCFNFGKRLAYSSADLYEYFIFCIAIINIIPLAIFSFIKYSTSGLMVDQIANDAIFGVIVYFPFVMMMNRRKWLKYILYILIMALAFMSLKRSIIITVVVSSIIYLLLTNHKEMFKKWYFWLAVIGIIYVGMYLYDTMGEMIAYRFSTMEEGGGSGRNVIYERIINAFKQSDLGDIIFGHGFMSVISINDWKLAHNDFLQLLYDYGVIGLTLFVCFLLSLCFLAIKKYKYRKVLVVANTYESFVFAISFYILLCVFNCFIYSKTWMTPMFLSIGMMYSILKNNDNYAET